MNERGLEDASDVLLVVPRTNCSTAGTCIADDETSFARGVRTTARSFTRNGSISTLSDVGDT